MANELKTAAPSGLTLYAQLETPSAQVWNGSVFQDYNQADWSSYAIALTERAGAGKYYGAMPAVAAGRYLVTTYLQSGASPAWGDTVNESMPFDWTGTAEATLAAVTAKDVRVEMTEIRTG